MQLVLSFVKGSTQLRRCQSSWYSRPRGFKFQHDTKPLVEAEQVWRLVDRLLYLNLTRPYITYVVLQLSQYVGEPCDTHMEVALHVVKYLKGTPSTEVFYHSALEMKLAYCDSDLATCPITRRSLIGYCIVLGPNVISWKTKKKTYCV